MAPTRNRSTTLNGGSFEASVILAVWNKGRIVSGVDPRVRRKDSCGAWIELSAYGDKTEFGYGWEIDHVKPVSRGGPDELFNLQPLQWQNNRAKGDSEGGWTTAVSAKN